MSHGDFTRAAARPAALAAARRRSHDASPPPHRATCAYHALRRGIGEAHRRYSLRVNRREGWTGHLWRSRFASFVMDGARLMAAARYVELTPVRAGLVERPEACPWPARRSLRQRRSLPAVASGGGGSSPAAHVSGKPDVLAASTWPEERTAGWVCSWGEYLMREEDAGALGERLHRHERTGRALGPWPFVERLEKVPGRGLPPRERGLQPKAEGRET